MRFVLYVTILVAILPLVLRRPFFGLCVYYVVSLLQPKLLCWRGDFQDAMLVGVPLVIGAVAFGVKRVAVEPETEPKTGQIVGIRERLVRNQLLEPAWPIALFVLLVGYIAITRLFVPFPLSHTSYQFRGLCKVLLVVVLMTGLASDLRRFRILYIVVALATAFWAIKGGFKVILLGPHQVYGRTYDNNFFALVSVMTLPMIFYFSLSVRHGRWRPLLLFCAAMTCLGIIGSRSRAGFVAFAFVLLCMAWSSRYRLRAVFAVVTVTAVVMFMSGGEIRDRIDSILAYEQDRSSRSRFHTWHVARRLLEESPLIGVGFNNFEIANTRFVSSQKAAHNIYLQNAAELGQLGHPLWLTIIFGTLVSMYRFMRWSRRLPPDMRWAYYWSRGLLLGLAAFCIHGMFHNEEYLELMFVGVGLNIALQVTTRRELHHRRLYSLVEETRRKRKARKRSRRTEPQGPHAGLMFERPRTRRGFVSKPLASLPSRTVRLRT
jgi:probable O-glycosylation ligase (exosortase A-associated)